MRPQPWSALLMFFFASACAARDPTGNQAAIAQRNGFPTDLAQMTEVEFNGIYTHEYFLQFPGQARELIRRNMVESTICEGNYPDERERYRACNRRYRVLLELEQLGWCWGGGRISAEEHWLPCSKDPYRNRPLSRELPFPEVEGNGVASEGR